MIVPKCIFMRTCRHTAAGMASCAAYPRHAKLGTGQTLIDAAANQGSHGQSSLTATTWALAVATRQQVRAPSTGHAMLA
eukprot:1159381-Pelagomonas_calceolata.AAC.4